VNTTKENAMTTQAQFTKLIDAVYNDMQKAAEDNTIPANNKIEFIINSHKLLMQLGTMSNRNRELMMRLKDED